ncbi:MAG TPA: DUF4397 domain-containing protein [Streptosporangiaceae bacterium]|jgi:hypothetical protein
MYSLTKVRRLALGVAAAGFAGTLGLLALTAPAASAQTTSSVGWVRLAHLSPNTPAVDVYLYSFGDAKAQLVLDHVTYGTVSPYEQLAAGNYTVAMRLAGAAAGTKPVLSTTVDVAAGDAYTVAGMGPASGLRLTVFDDPLTTPSGKALVQVIQASLLQGSVSVRAGGHSLASGLKFGKATGFVAVPAGTWTVRAAGSSQAASEQISLAAGTVHTLVVLDDPGKLGIDDLLDAAGSIVAPSSGVNTGLGGTAARPGAPMLPWAAAGLVGLLAAAGGVIMVSRRRRPALHAR